MNRDTGARNRSMMFAVLTSLLGIGCGKVASDHGDAKSLDNFSGGSFHLNACHGDEPAVAKDDQIAASADLKSEIRSALSAVPAPLKTAFFGELQGKVIVTGDIARACTDGKGVHTEAAAGLISCWQAPTPSSVAIYVKEEKTRDQTIRNIRHATVRSFGYMLSQFMLRLENTASGTVLTDNAALDAVKSELAMATILNVAAHEKMDLQAFRGKAPSGVLARNLSEAERKAAWAKAAQTEQGRQFADFVLAEAFDSYYCSAETKAKLATDFSREGADVHQMMADLGAEIVRSFGAAPAESGTELGLWGRWGAGNGPLRAAFRGVGQWRASGRGLFNFRRARAGGGFIFNRGGLGARWFG